LKGCDVSPAVTNANKDKMRTFAERLVIETKAMVARQRELVARLRAQGDDAIAEQTALGQFEKTLKLYEQDLQTLSA
jgi:hypothetical protein